MNLIVNTSMNAAQMMPASAILDSEDEGSTAQGGGGNGGGDRRGSARRSSGNGNASGLSSGLAAIDITTPLEEDEIMPEVKPYVVS